MKFIKHVFIALLLAINIAQYSNSQALIGEVRKEDFKPERPQVVDAITKNPVKDAAVAIPSQNEVDFTDKNGYFNIAPSGNKPIILSVQKEGYRPFSMTVSNGTLKGGILLELTPKAPFEIVVSDSLLHLGDNSYSPNSAGACLINSPCIGPVFNKEFSVGSLSPKTKAYVTIGSVIGIDTIQAMKLGQNNLTNAASTPMEFFINKTKIGELKINGDNQKIPIPIKLLKPNASNTLTVKTGANRDSFDIDYDDVELINLIVDIKN